MPIDVTKVQPHQHVDLYISPTCPYCRQAIEFYTAQHVPFSTHDAQNDRSARARMFAYTNSDPTVPAIVVDGTYVQSGWGSPPRG